MTGVKWFSGELLDLLGLSMYEEVKNYLVDKRKEGDKSVKKPIGAMQSPWAFIPSEPKENFNEVYPNILLGN